MAVPSVSRLTSLTYLTYGRDIGFDNVSYVCVHMPGRSNCFVSDSIAQPHPGDGSQTTHFRCSQFSSTFRMYGPCQKLAYFAFCQSGTFSLPNAAEASDIRLFTSEEFETTLPRNTSLFTCLTVLPSRSTAGSLQDVI